jgi:hypothetical protein
MAAADDCFGSEAASAKTGSAASAKKSHLEIHPNG